MQSPCLVATLVMGMVKIQMKRDRKEIQDEKARSKKFNHIYKKCFHPNKMGQVETLKQCANEITKAILNEKDWYLRP